MKHSLQLGSRVRVPFVLSTVEGEVVDWYESGDHKDVYVFVEFNVSGNDERPEYFRIRVLLEEIEFLGAA